jgi:hypothetical protein
MNNFVGQRGLESFADDENGSFARRVVIATLEACDDATCFVVMVDALHSLSYS